MGMVTSRLFCGTEAPAALIQVQRAVHVQASPMPQMRPTVAPPAQAKQGSEGRAAGHVAPGSRRGRAQQRLSRLLVRASCEPVPSAQPRALSPSACAPGVNTMEGAALVMV